MNSLRKKIGAAALGGSLVFGGAAAAYAITGTAGAQETTTTTAAAAAPTQESGRAPAGQFDPSKGGHVANGITETVLTGDDATKATAAATEAVPGGTVERVETDAEGATYEAHVTKADGSHVTVKLDADFKVTSTEDGMR